MPNWRDQAKFPLTSIFSIDTIYQGLNVLRLDLVSVLGELILILMHHKLLPSMLQCRSLEKTLSSFWLHRGSSSLEQVPLTDVESNVPSIKRVMWNRAVRRCQFAGFGEYKNSFLARVSWPPKLHLNQILSRQRSLRTRLRLLLYCQIFEIMETNDVGYIDMGEFRSLSKVINILTQQKIAIIDFAVIINV